MALNTRHSSTARNLQADAIGDNSNTGYIRIYDGSQPADGDTAITTQNLLAELRLNADAFGASSSGVITANAITSGTASATGTAAWFRVLKSDGTTVLFDGSVGTSGANLNLGTTSIVSGAVVAISSLTYTVPMQGA